MRLGGAEGRNKGRGKKNWGRGGCYQTFFVTLPAEYDSLNGIVTKNLFN
jgi:hypothetical protein